MYNRILFFWFVCFSWPEISCLELLVMKSKLHFTSSSYALYVNYSCVACFLCTTNYPSKTETKEKWSCVLNCIREWEPTPVTFIQAFDSNIRFWWGTITKCTYYLINEKSSKAFCGKYLSNIWAKRMLLINQANKSTLLQLQLQLPK